MELWARRVNVIGPEPDMKLLIFDLDGTLIDSRLDLANAVNAALQRMGRAPLPNERIYSYVGDGAPTLLRRAMGPEAPQEDVHRALGHFLDCYGQHLLDNTRPYPGVDEALGRFAEAGIPMAVLTNKPERFSRELVRGLGWENRFFQVYGGDSLPEKKPHPLGIETLMREAGARPEQTLMIGDSAVDVLTARNAGVPVAAVTYGLQPETLGQYPPDILVDSLAELARELLDPDRAAALSARLAPGRG